jgi:hypothetical protein
MSDQRSEVLSFGPLARLRVHMAIIRKALGERQFCSRYISYIEGEAYAFVGSVVCIEQYPGLASLRGDKAQGLRT